MFSANNRVYALKLTKGKINVSEKKITGQICLNNTAFH